MNVEAVAPCRIDLAGGTLDIWPLYLFLDGALTVNIGIDLFSRVRISPRDDTRVHLRSLDTGAELEANSVDELPLGGPLDLVARAVRFYRPATGIDLSTENSAPKGSGLGASSSLLICLSGALNALNGASMAPERLVDCAADAAGVLRHLDLRSPVTASPAAERSFPPAPGAGRGRWLRPSQRRGA